MDNKKFQKSSEKFFCSDCYYFTSRLSQYDRHILTAKHKRITMDKKMDNMDNKKVPHHNQCKCGKQYKFLSGLSKHKKFCTINDVHEDTDESDNELKMLTNLVLEVVKSSNEIQKQNNQLQTHIIELCKTGANNTNTNTNMITNNTICNSNNKTFNLNVFLNEQCKDAMNIMDFVDSLKLQLSDLEIVGKLGFVDGISDIIVRNLKALDIHKRPVHCSDSKREVIYVKDQDKWYNDSKENENNKKLKKAIKHVANKNSKNLSLFKELHPDCIYSHSKTSDQYNKIIIEALGGSGNLDDENENKIVKKIAKEVLINK